MNKWNGVDKRVPVMQMNQDDRDRFIRMEANSESLIKTLDAHLKAFNDHVEDDKKQFVILQRIIGGISVLGLCAALFLKYF